MCVLSCGAAAAIAGRATVWRTTQGCQSSLGGEEGGVAPCLAHCWGVGWGLRWLPDAQKQTGALPCPQWEDGVPRQACTSWRGVKGAVQTAEVLPASVAPSTWTVSGGRHMWRVL